MSRNGCLNPNDEISIFDAMIRFSSETFTTDGGGKWEMPRNNSIQWTFWSLIRDEGLTSEIKFNKIALKVSLK